MVEIRDCLGRLVCKADPETGKISVIINKQKTEFYLRPGMTYLVERDFIRTTVEYSENEYFFVDSKRIT